MNTILSRRQAVAAISGGAALPLVGGWQTALGSALTTPDNYGEFTLNYQHDRQELVGDLLDGPRGEAHRQSEVEHAHWYSHHVRQHYGAWGPPQRRYIPLPGLDERSTDWKRERVIATAARFIGYGYHHLYIPDWNPPAHWPWKQCCMGHNGKGVDCSNFTTFVYNQGFGIYMSSGIGEQARERVASFGHEEVKLQRIELPREHAARREVLKTGDLVYILGREGGHVTHVVMWVGAIGLTPNGEPLILDSHGGDVVDDDGRPIPCGIHLRPFRQQSWYNRCASHAHRVFA
jgi:cell wall-associated NlpC family hydrolase